ncbi:MAG TPA: RIP metalloprotease RseP [Candidatus Margulisbacteria bacterium]|nr:MAG: RIP metalloprotease RseP [Candidatus Margulisbacteria bacterium GWE2_39_32]HCT85777.1 RIP metalloprotease RseP [Candidatus Margulisiibacteriota bacterium]
MMISILAFLFVFATVVFVHELGHFGVAKLMGVRVFEFGLGFGPKLIKFKRNGTIYSVNAIPLGGFVKIAGLDDEEVKSPDYEPGESYNSKKLWQRILIILAGPVMNVVLAFAVFSAINFFVGVPGSVTNTIEKIIPSSPASISGLRSGDKILKVNNYTVTNMEQAIRIINDSKGELLNLVILRSGQSKTIQLRAFYDKTINRYILGINLASGPNIRYNPFVSLKFGVLETYQLSRMIIVGMVAFFTGHIPLEQVAGPIGIAQMSSQVAKEGFLILLRFLSFLSINLGILNLIPFPALDGGRILFLLFEGIAGKNVVTVKRENFVHYIGFVILILFIIFVTYHDIVRIFK